ncbi:MAG: histidinol-phosphatase [Clostridia bacterium]|nr:histidinol-phosphatase [Clostridia bacterium]
MEKPTVNYHTHTARCRHATGTEREFVETAIKEGIKVLGFADHAPYYFPDGYYSNFRMLPDETENYVNTILSLKKEYATDIDIYLGYEMEYYPAYFDKAVRQIGQYPHDYLILGQHFIGNENDGHIASMRETDDEGLLRIYVDQVISAMNTGVYFYVAHPDVFHFVGDKETYVKHYTRLCREAKRLNVPLELNLLGVFGGRHYPNIDFWKIAGEISNDVIIGFDAHRPSGLEVDDNYPKIERIINECGLHIISPLSPTVKNDG